MEAAFGHFEQFAKNLNTTIEPGVRQHLSKVYSCLTATATLATIGAYLHLYGILEAGLLSALGCLGLVLAIHFTTDNGKNFYTRFGMLLGFGFCTGQTLGPLLDNVIRINPQIIVTALIGTSVVFVSFSIAAMIAQRGKFLFLGGILMSILNTMALFGLANLFFRSTMIFQAQLYVGLGVMSTFILYDTQAIMEKYRMGSRDCVSHSLDLFFDFVSVFRRLLIILSQKEQQRDQRRRKSN